MTTCYSCRWSFFDIKSFHAVVGSNATVTGKLRCRPSGECQEQAAETVCAKYEREPGADEPSEVNTTEERK